VSTAANISSPASAENVIALLREIAKPLATENVSLSEARQRVLREPALAPEDQPAFDRSAVDGFAVRLDDARTEFQIVDEIRAGDWKPRELQLGEAVKISTGGALPSAGLQIVMREDAEASDERLRVTQREPETNIRFRGDDCRAGQILVERGTTLSHGTLALLASVGHAKPLVTRRPRAVHFATGNEIIPPEQTPQRGQIRDSNSILVRTFLEKWSAELTQHRLPEEEAMAKSQILNVQSEIESADLLLVSGGASVGEHDFTRRLLEDLGFEILVSKTTLRPGKPLIVARRGHQIAFGLPGNPLAHFVCLNLFARTVLEGFSSAAPKELFQCGVLAGKLDADGNARETFWPATAELNAGRMELTPLRWSNSGDLTSLAQANALVRVVAGEMNLAVGTKAEFVATDF
jgi:molybdopterin molybdotransferase